MATPAPWTVACMHMNTCTYMYTCWQMLSHWSSLIHPTYLYHTQLLLSPVHTSPFNTLLTSPLPVHCPNSSDSDPHYRIRPTPMELDLPKFLELEGGTVRPCKWNYREPHSQHSMFIPFHGWGTCGLLWWAVNHIHNTTASLYTWHHSTYHTGCCMESGPQSGQGRSMWHRKETQPHYWKRRIMENLTWQHQHPGLWPRGIQCSTGRDRKPLFSIFCAFILWW